MAYYTRYEKLQKYYKDGTAVSPAEFKKGTNLGVAEYSSIEVCEGHPEPEPGNYTCCITWEAYNDLNFSFNNKDINTKENPWCTQEKVSKLDFHKSQSEIESLDITIDETNNITSMYLAFGQMGYLRSVKLNIPKAANLSDISYMFKDSINLTSINFINFDTSNVTTAHGAFRHCSSLTSLNLKNFDMSKATSYDGMFGECDKLKNIICKQAFKDWCIAYQDEINLPDAMREGGSGTWIIVD